VSEAHVRSALAAVRGLGRAGVEVSVMGPSPTCAGRLSRYAGRWKEAPDSGTDPRAHGEAIRAEARRRPGTVVYPGTETSLDACLTLGAGDGTALRLPYHQPGALDVLRDKPAMARLARLAGLGTPEELYTGPISGLPADVAFPSIVKPSRPAPGGGTATVVTDPAELESLRRDTPQDLPVVVQERVQGPLMACTVVLDEDGRLRAEFHQRALRIWPAGAGSSSRAVGIAPDRELSERVVAMLVAAGYSGLAQVQYIAAARGPVVIDVNPRFYGSLPLAIASGCNLPATWHSAVTGAPFVPPAPYREGVTFRWLEADLSDARHGDLRALRPARRPGVGAVWSSRDPLPSAVLAADAVLRVVDTRLKRSHGRRTQAP
jgi:predicted ATP-grasp superfamily ATP-dependent carboligase